jgi:hypothetical protein
MVLGMQKEAWLSESSIHSWSQISPRKTAVFAVEGVRQVVQISDSAHKFFLHQTVQMAFARPIQSFSERFRRYGVGVSERTDTQLPAKAHQHLQYLPLNVTDVTKYFWNVPSMHGTFATPDVAQFLALPNPFRDFK